MNWKHLRIYIYICIYVYIYIRAHTSIHIKLLTIWPIITYFGCRGQMQGLFFPPSFFSSSVHNCSSFEDITFQLAWRLHLVIDSIRHMFHIDWLTESLIIGPGIRHLKSCSLSQVSLQWCHNEHHGVSNHQPRNCLLNRLFRHRWKKTSKHLCGGIPVNSPHKGPVTRKIFLFDDVIHGKYRWRLGLRIQRTRLYLD